MNLFSLQSSHSANTHSSEPFFKKKENGDFFNASHTKVQPFFKPSIIQPHLTIGNRTRKNPAPDNHQNHPDIQLSPDYSLIPRLLGLGVLDLEELIQIMGQKALSNLHLPFDNIPFPFQDPLDLPLPWEYFQGLDPWEVIKTIVKFLKSIWDLINSMPDGGGGGATTSQSDPLPNMNVLQSPGGSGWRGALYGCYRNGCTRRHRGWDLFANVGTNIYAIQDGTISHHQNAGGYGDYIFLTSGNVRYRYAHLSSRQQPGQYNSGDLIGQTGISGNANSNRPHLHLEVQENTNSVDPAGYFSTPSQVRASASPFGITNINTSEPEPCNPCAM